MQFIFHQEPAFQRKIVVSRYDDDGNSLKFVTSDNIATADAITFLWTETFPLGFYAPAVVPPLVISQQFL